MSLILRLILLVAAKLVLLGAILGTYAYDMRTGQEIVVRTEPVDPRSLFRGHYVILNYAFTEVPEAALGEACVDYGDVVFVTLREASPMDWRPVAAFAAMPDDGFGAGRVTLRGIVQQPPDCETRAGVFRVDYGLSAYFASPEMAKDLERQTWSRDPEQRLPIILSVPPSGRALIKGVIHNGERFTDNEIF